MFFVGILPAILLCNFFTGYAPLLKPCKFVNRCLPVVCKSVAISYRAVHVFMQEALVISGLLTIRT